MFVIYVVLYRKKTMKILIYYIYYKFRLLEILPSLIHRKMLIPLQERANVSNSKRKYLYMLGMFLQLIHSILIALFVISYGKSRSYYPKIKCGNRSSIQGIFKDTFRVKIRHLQLEASLMFYCLIYYFLNNRKR